MRDNIARRKRRISIWDSGVTTVSRTIVSVFFPGYFPLASDPASRGKYPECIFSRRVT